MCGIVGYYGPQNPKDVIMSGLKALEYRGYDSAGVAILDHGVFKRVRAEGKLGNLADKLQNEKFDGHLGIGHTRWATHGRPSERNAHPHADCSGRVAVVHNGIIENYRELKKRLTAAGHRFASETDSEIFAHLIEEARNGDGFQAAVLRALRQVTGTFAIAVLSVEDPSRLYAARRGSPLIIGRGSGEQLLASDIPALLPFTREQLVLEEGELAIL